jgi:hypothetical protein
MKSQIVADAATYVLLEILFTMNDIAGQDPVGGTRRTDPPESMASTTPWSNGVTFTLVACLLLQVIECAATEEENVRDIVIASSAQLSYQVNTG